MSNYERFTATLAKHYAELFTLPEYALAASRYTPDSMAEKFAALLATGSGANKDGDGIRRTCKELAIKHTYKAISEYLQGAA